MPRTSLRLITLALFTVVLARVPAAQAVDTPKSSLWHGGWKRLDGSTLRKQPRTRFTPPAVASRAWHRFRREHPNGDWRAVWDHDTGVPLRVYGGGIAVPGATKDAARGEAAARSVLDAHLDLLAPGATSGDFELSANHIDLDETLRTVNFAQRSGGYVVRGASIGVRIREDRIIVIASTAAPAAGRATVSTLLSSDGASKRAFAHLATAAPQATLSVVKTTGPFVLPLVSEEGVSAQPLVFEVELESALPFGRWSVFVDALSGAVVGRRTHLRFSQAFLSVDVPRRHPGRGRETVPASEMDVLVDGTIQPTDTDGRLRWPEGSTAPTLEARLSGRRARVINAAGPNFRGRYVADADASVVLGAPDDALVDAQLGAFASIDRVSRYIERVAPESPVLTSPVVAEVNAEGECNAFFDGEGLHFFRGSERCENTARIFDVVAHEYGHVVHRGSLIEGAGRFDPALSEALSDYLAAAMTDDPGMGRGFFRDHSPLRHLAPEDPARWPEDVAGDPHSTGLILAGALWDLRSELIRSLGFESGTLAADRLWFAALLRASDIPSVYAEVLAADDDDGNLANGTPHGCAIQTAFARHGLAEPHGGLQLGSIRFGGNHARVAVSHEGPSCPGSKVLSAEMAWRIRDGSSTGSEAMRRIGSELVAPMPSVAPGSVLEVRIELQLESGEQIQRPLNPASPWYEHYVGEVEPLFCTDFEDDPWQAGWTHELRVGEDRNGADDWQWGPPAGEPGSGDPGSAHSGTHVVGNDLGQGLFNGRYQAGKTNALVSPSIQVPLGYASVRLQYRRWLNVEDAGFDQARILSNGVAVWENAAGSVDRPLHHEDREWRFHDVDLGWADSDREVVLAFELSADAGLDFGGWTLDDLCVVGVRRTQSEWASSPGHDGPCSNERKPPCDEVEPAPPEPGPLGPGCGCTSAGTHATGSSPLGLGLLGLLVLLRRRR